MSFFLYLLLSFFCIFFTLFCLLKFLKFLSYHSPEMKRKRFINKMLSDGFKRNHLGHWVK